MTATRTPMLDAALFYAARGWHVVPVFPREKRPAIPDWVEASTTNTDLIVMWFTEHPDYGVGIVMGERSGLWTLDVDSYNGGDDTLADLIAEHGSIPDTLESITGGGGRHIIFAWPGWNPGTGAGQLGPGLDIRADGGFIVAPPTVHKSGARYMWELTSDPNDGLKPADAPDWLLELCKPRTQPLEPPRPAATTRRSDDALPDWPELLTHSGATYAGTRTRRQDGTSYSLWCRPGKDPREGTSATLGYGGSDILKIHTTNWPGFTAGETANRFHYYATIQHGGDHARARRELDRLSETADLEALAIPVVEHAQAVELEQIEQTVDQLRDGLVDGATFVLDQPEGVPARWGTDDRVLWARGEACVIVGGSGVGKSTLTANIVRGLLGIDQLTLDLPIEPANRILYLALDRPRQIARTLRRLLHDTPRHILEARLVVRQTPFTDDLQTNTIGLYNLCQAAQADILIVDSLKDLIYDPADNKQGAAWNRAMQHCVAHGIDVLALHHNRKKTSNDTQPKSLHEVYGSAWIVAGAGSVLLLAGDAGDALIELRHLKQPVAEIGPLQLEHHHDGRMTIDSGAIDPLKVLRGAPTGLTAVELARIATGKSNPAEKDHKKAKRQLESLVARELASKIEGRSGGPKGTEPARYHATEVSDLLANGQRRASGHHRTPPDTPSGHPADTNAKAQVNQRTGQRTPADTQRTLSPPLRSRGAGTDAQITAEDLI